MVVGEAPTFTVRVRVLEGLQTKYKMKTLSNTESDEPFEITRTVLLMAQDIKLSLL